ncbi:MAG: mechanosensitive ion channel family protein [Pyrinomonadaceae bacterium]
MFKNIDMYLVIQSLGWWNWFGGLTTDVHGAVSNSINSMVTGLFARLPFVLAGIIVLLIFWLLSKLAKNVFLVSTRRTKLDARLRLLFSRMLVVLVVGIGVLTSLTVILPGFSFGSMIAGLGFSSFAVGFAVKDILNNFFSGILILWQEPFQTGDYLFVGDEQGKVEYIGVRATSLRKDDGELVLIPNGDMYSRALTIRGAGANRRMNLAFCVAYQATLERVKVLIMEALGSTDGVVNDPAPNVIISDLTPEGVAVKVSFWINTNHDKPLEVFDRASIGIVEKLNAAEIAIYPAEK